MRGKPQGDLTACLFLYHGKEQSMRNRPGRRVVGWKEENLTERRIEGMRDDFIFGLLEDIRLGILKELHEVPESKRRIVPNGFNNHLHWQAGHILTVTDAIMFYFGSGKSRVDESYAVFFATGTRPSGWSGQPPAWEDILAQLHDQISQIRQTFKGKLHEPAAVSDNFLNAVTVDELFQIFLSHESIHTGMVTAMIKALQDLQG